MPEPGSATIATSARGKSTNGAAFIFRGDRSVFSPKKGERHCRLVAMPKARNALIIINPHAGRARKAHQGPLDRARKILQSHGLESEVVATDAPGAASELARAAVRD